MHIFNSVNFLSSETYFATRHDLFVCIMFTSMFILFPRSHLSLLTLVLTSSLFFLIKLQINLWSMLLLFIGKEHISILDHFFKFSSFIYFLSKFTIIIKLTIVYDISPSYLSSHWLTFYDNF